MLGRVKGRFAGTSTRENVFVRDRDGQLEKQSLSCAVRKRMISTGTFIIIVIFYGIFVVGVQT